jgi:hypothetical protein
MSGNAPALPDIIAFDLISKILPKLRSSPDIMGKNRI